MRASNLPILDTADQNDTMVMPLRFVDDDYAPRLWAVWFILVCGSAGQGCFIWAALACSNDGTTSAIVNLQSQSVHPQTGGLPDKVQKVWSVIL